MRTDSIASHDGSTLGEFKDDQLEDHKHNLGTQESSGQLTIRGGTSFEGNSAFRGSGELATAIYVQYVNGNARRGSVTRGKRKGVNYLIKVL